MVAWSSKKKQNKKTRLSHAKSAKTKEAELSAKEAKMRSGAFVPLYVDRRVRECVQSQAVPLYRWQQWKKKKKTHMCSVQHAEMLEDVQGVYP